MANQVVDQAADRDRLVIQSADMGMRRYLDLAQPVHEEYARRCSADYLRFDGQKEHLHPAWNRIPLFLDAFAAGYSKVVWIDADALVVNPDVDIFSETPDDIPVLLMWSGLLWRGPCPHCGAGPSDYPDYLYPVIATDECARCQGTGECDQFCYNNGVLVANNLPPAVELFEYTWQNRHSPPLPHHRPAMHEGNFFLDWCLRNRRHIGWLEQRFNRPDFSDAIPVKEAVLRGWHGMPGDQRWAQFSSTYEQHYGKQKRRGR